MTSLAIKFTIIHSCLIRIFFWQTTLMEKHQQEQNGVRLMMNHIFYFQEKWELMGIGRVFGTAAGKQLKKVITIPFELEEEFNILVNLFTHAAMTIKWRIMQLPHWFHGIINELYGSKYRNDFFMVSVIAS